MAIRIIFLLILLGWSLHLEAVPAVAFFYGKEPPIDELGAFDWVVVQPYGEFDPKTLKPSTALPFAYVSVGEMSREDPFAKLIPRDCLIGTNPIWKTRIVDHANPACRRFHLDVVIDPLWRRGFRGFFLDTLDSYQLISGTAAERQRHEAGLVALIQAIRRQYPEAKLILNRGFPFLARVAGIVDAVAAESLYHRWNQRRRRYEPVPEEDRRWLLERLRAAKALGLEVIVIDYLPPNRRAQARRLAARIRQMGFVPWIGNGDLDWLGVGLREVLPRKVLAITDAEDIYLSEINMNLSLPLNHLGYSVRPHRPDAPLPAGPIEGIFAGIVVWLEKPLSPPEQECLWRWLLRQKRTQVPIVFIGSFGFPTDTRHLAPFGLITAPTSGPTRRIRHLAAHPDYFGFEAPVLPSIDDFFPLRPKEGTILLQLESDQGQTQVAAAITGWGGYVLDPYLIMATEAPLEDDIRTLWILNPFAFLKAALRHPDAPVPDITTRSGRRVLTIHIDGDGFVNRSRVRGYNGKLAGEVMEKEVISRFPLPTSVSFIAAEFTDDGLHSRLAPALRRIARRILALPWVEPATHTYSHPFDWQTLERHPGWSAGSGGGHANEALPYGYNLKVPGYRFDPWMETVGSARLIEKLLTPPGKRVAIVNWSGDTDPGLPSLEAAYRGGLLNINGGEKPLLRRYASLTNLPGNGVWKGPYFQVFAPQANENDYTHLWQGPYFGFRNLLHSLVLTDTPRRLKPVTLYYHFYSAERPAALKALKTVYHQIMQQPLQPIRTSTYIRSALAFERLVIAREDDHWLIRNYGEASTLRVPRRLGRPDPTHSRHVAGYTPARDGPAYYVHLVPAESARLVLRDTPPSLPFVASANATVTRYAVEGPDIAIALHGEVPITATFHKPDGCRLRRTRPRPRRRIPESHTLTLHFHAKDAALEFHCRP